MKRIFSTLAVVTFIISLCSCAERTPAEKKMRVSTAPLDPELIGTWTNENAGYRFGDNRKVTLVIDFSERAHFTENREFYTLNALISGDNVQYDGTHLKAVNFTEGITDADDPSAVLIDMERTDEANNDSLDGYYEINGGVVTSVIASELNISPEKIDFEGKIEGEKLVIYAVDCFDYEIVDGKLDIFSDLFNYVDEQADCLTYTYSIEKDVLTMNLQSVGGTEDEVYTKCEE